MYTLSQVHDTAQRILNALSAAPPEAHRALLGVVVPTLEALWQRLAAMAPAIAADAAPPGWESRRGTVDGGSNDDTDPVSAS